MSMGADTILGHFHSLYVPFRDPSMGVCTFHVTVLDCLRAVYKAALLGAASPACPPQQTLASCGSQHTVPATQQLIRERCRVD
jgi:hypothetical protein